MRGPARRDAAPAKRQAAVISRMATSRKPRRPAGRASSLDRLRMVCLAFPEAHEVEAWGEPTFRVRGKIFAMYASANNHHGAGRPGVWCKSIAVTQDALVRAEPDRFFVPPYVGPRGWTGVRLDGPVRWDVLEDLLTDAWRSTAPRRIAALLAR